MRSAPARPMTTKLIWLDTCPMEPAKRLVRLRNGTTIEMDRAIPDIDGLGMLASMNQQPARATIT